MAATLAQADLPEQQKLHTVKDEYMPRQFNLAYDRMGLHEHAGGLRMRPWREYADCGYVGMFTLAWQSSMIPVGRG